MAHISGYTGSITFNGAEGPTVFKPTVGTTVELQSWTLRQTVDTFNAFAKGESFETVFPTAGDWTATVVFLQQDGALSDELQIREDGSVGKTVDVEFVTASPDKFSGTGIVSKIDTDDPLDGPVVVTVEIEGDSAIVSTIA